MIEGRLDALLKTKSFFMKDPGAWHALLEKLSRITVAYLNAQIVAGAQAVQLFDTWVGCLGPADYRAFSCRTPSASRRRHPRHAVIPFRHRTAGLLPLMREAGGGVIGLDWRLDLVQAWDGWATSRCREPDPTVLFAPRDEVRRRTLDLLGRVGGRPGHIFNLGHGILPHTPLDNVLALVDAVPLVGRRCEWPAHRARFGPLLGFGGPTRRDEVRPFLDNVLRANRSGERYEEVVRHYDEAGGSSLSRLTLAQAERLRLLLSAEGPVLGVRRNASLEPYITDTLTEMAHEGRRRPSAWSSAHRSPPSWEVVSRERGRGARAAGDSAPVVDYVGGGPTIPSSSRRSPNGPGRHRLGSGARRGRARIVFTAQHPTGMAERSGIHRGSEAHARPLAGRLGVATWSLAFTSRSGQPVGPGSSGHRRRAAHPAAGRRPGRRRVADRFPERSRGGLYDLDIAARRTADGLGIGFFARNTGDLLPSSACSPVRAGSW